MNVTFPRSKRKIVTASLPPLIVALKIAREATDDVPIAKQVLGAVIQIVETAEKAKNNREALQSLAEKSAKLVQQIVDVVSGRTVQAPLAAHLEVLRGIFTEVKDFMDNRANGTSAGKRLRRLYQDCFVITVAESGKDKTPNL